MNQPNINLTEIPADAIVHIVHPNRKHWEETATDFRQLFPGVKLLFTPGPLNILRREAPKVLPEIPTLITGAGHPDPAQQQAADAELAKRYVNIGPISPISPISCTPNNCAFQAPTPEDPTIFDKARRRQGEAAMTHIHKLLSTDFAGLRITPNQAAELCNRIQMHATLSES